MAYIRGAGCTDCVVYIRAHDNSACAYSEFTRPSLVSSADTPVIQDMKLNVITREVELQVTSNPALKSFMAIRTLGSDVGRHVTFTETTVTLQEMAAVPTYLRVRGSYGSSFTAFSQPKRMDTHFGVSIDEALCDGTKLFVRVSRGNHIIRIHFSDGQIIDKPASGSMLIDPILCNGTTLKIFTTGGQVNSRMAIPNQIGGYVTPKVKRADFYNNKLYIMMDTRLSEVSHTYEVTIVENESVQKIFVLNGPIDSVRDVICNQCVIYVRTYSKEGSSAFSEPTRPTMHPELSASENFEVIITRSSPKLQWDLPARHRAYRVIFKPLAGGKAMEIPLTSPRGTQHIKKYKLCTVYEFLLVRRETNGTNTTIKNVTIYTEPELPVNMTINPIVPGELRMVFDLKTSGSCPLHYAIHNLAALNGTSMLQFGSPFTIKIHNPEKKMRFKHAYTFLGFPSCVLLRITVLPVLQGLQMSATYSVSQSHLLESPKPEEVVHELQGNNITIKWKKKQHCPALYTTVTLNSAQQKTLEHTVTFQNLVGCVDYTYIVRLYFRNNAMVESDPVTFLCKWSFFFSRDFKVHTSVIRRVVVHYSQSEHLHHKTVR
ncbi:hypothetical protein CRM22_010657 [Opisthorchis felineus]|uniref:Fibronectin type-III domain-containing protein n=1 Tax=Opisthorchis felineus TaxID=147828 RepID=A0A4S2KQX9_OPIFE|nr:hypothetical protein CRM22_010657 [Opisthorchis felineus]